MIGQPRPQHRDHGLAERVMELAGELLGRGVRAVAKHRRSFAERRRVGDPEFVQGLNRCHYPPAKPHVAVRQRVGPGLDDLDGAARGEHERVLGPGERIALGPRQRIGHGVPGGDLA